MHFSAHTTATSTEICLTKLGCSPSTGWNRMDQSDQTKDFLTGGVQVRLMLWFPSKRAARRSISVLGVRGFMAERTNDLMLCRWRVTERGTVLLLSRILKGYTLFVHIAARWGSLRRLRNVNRDAGSSQDERIYQEGEEDGSGDAAAGGADRLFSQPLCSRFCIAFSNSFW